MQIHRPGFPSQYIDEPAPQAVPAQSETPLLSIAEAKAAAEARAAANPPAPTETTPSPEAERMADAIKQGQVAAASSPSLPVQAPDIIANPTPSPVVVERPVPFFERDPERKPESLTHQEQERVAAAIEIANEQAAAADPTEMSKEQTSAPDPLTA
jgi:hypothetical protein